MISQSETGKVNIEEKGVPLSYILAVIVVLLSVLIIAVILKGKSKNQKNDDFTTHQKESTIPQAELIDVHKIISEKSLVLGKRVVEIGREEDKDITIPEDTISSLHATIEYRDNSFFLEDQRSTNGTSLNNEKIEPNKPIKLKSGDQIHFDVYEFRFLLPDQAPAGKTKLAVHNKPKTILRPQQSDKEKEVEPVNDRVSSDSLDPENERQTKLKPGMCPNHPSRRATELCEECKKAFCKQCVSEIDGKIICSECNNKRP